MPKKSKTIASVIQRKLLFRIAKTCRLLSYGDHYIKKFTSRGHEGGHAVPILSIPLIPIGGTISGLDTSFDTSLLHSTVKASDSLLFDILGAF
jgi:hypothetical protein